MLKEYKYLLNIILNFLRVTEKKYNQICIFMLTDKSRRNNIKNNIIFLFYILYVYIDFGGLNE